MGPQDGRGSLERHGSFVFAARRVDATPLDALRAASGPRVAWMAPEGPSFVGWGEATAVSASGPGRFDAVRRAAARLFSSIEAVGGTHTPVGPRLFGGFAFHDDHAAAPPWRGFTGARFVLPRLQLVDDATGSWLVATTGSAGPGAEPRAVLDEAADRLDGAARAASPPPGVRDLSRRPGRRAWRRQVRSVLDRIASGELEKVVLAQRLTARLDGPFRLVDALERLGGAYPGCYRFAVDPGLGAVFFGATPERLVSCHDDRIETEALAGSIGRGGTDDEDDRLARSLAGSPKARHEHALVVEALRDQFEPIAETVTVGTTGVRKLRNVQHLDTSVAADLSEPTHVLDLVEALHPTPAVGGLPPEVARRLIAETEGFERGWYAAPIGWFDASGDGTFAVGIRSGVASGSRIRLFAGNGIVADSDPDDEWDELQLKFRPILDQLR